MYNAVDCRLTEVRWPYITKTNCKQEAFLKGANQRGSAYRKSCLCLVTPSAFVNVTTLRQFSAAVCCRLFHEPQLPSTVCSDVKHSSHFVSEAGFSSQVAFSADSVGSFLFYIMFRPKNEIVFLVLFMFRLKMENPFYGWLLPICILVGVRFSLRRFSYRSAQCGQTMWGEFISYSLLYWIPVMIAVMIVDTHKRINV